MNSEEISKFTNKLISKITKNIESFRYNVIIANFYEMYNYFSKELKKPINKDILIENYSKILILLSPFIPHFTSECLSEINKYGSIRSDEWPKTNKKYLLEDKINLVVQIDGKKREILEIKKDLNQDEILEILNKNVKVLNHIKNKKIIKKIFVSNKIKNLILK